MGKGPFLRRQHVHDLSFSALVLRAIPSLSPSHALYVLAFPRVRSSVHSADFLKWFQTTGLGWWLPTPVCSVHLLPPPASSSHVRLHVRHLHLEISQAVYTRHIHWWSPSNLPLPPPGGLSLKKKKQKQPTNQLYSMISELGNIPSSKWKGAPGVHLDTHVRKCPDSFFILKVLSLPKSCQL